MHLKLWATKTTSQFTGHYPLPTAPFNPPLEIVVPYLLLYA